MDWRHGPSGRAPTGRDSHEAMSSNNYRPNSLMNIKVKILNKILQIEFNMIKLVPFQGSKHSSTNVITSIK
jgi:hypothetical protein